MTDEGQKKYDPELARAREKWHIASSGLNAKIRAFLRKWSVVIILGVVLLLSLVWMGYITVVWTGGGEGAP